MSAPHEGETKMSKHDLVDVNEMHGSLTPEQGPVLPIWLLIGFALLSFWGGGYLLQYSGGFRGDVFDESAVTYGPVTGAVAGGEDPKVIGARLYKATCAQCHQVDGKGVAGQYPPLAGSEWVLGPQNRVGRVLLNGMTGPVKVSGSTYNGNMAPWKDVLSDKQISQILTYVRSEWGNNASPITPEGMSALRKEVGTRADPWSEKELLAIPAADLAPPAK